MNGKAKLNNATGARFPSASLAALAELRRDESISVLKGEPDCWAFWEPGNLEPVRLLLPMPDVAFFERKGDNWHPCGRLLPSFDVPDPDLGSPLSRVLFPAPASVVDAERVVQTPVYFNLVRDVVPRDVSAAYCSLTALADWAESAPTRAIESLRGVLLGDSALLLGSNLPQWPGATRYWGDRVLIPLGYSLEPSLPESIVVEALGGGEDEIFRFLDPEATPAESGVVESVPVESFRVLSRASIRLASRKGGA